MSYSNKEIGKILKSTAELMELHGYNSFSAKSYLNAAIAIERYERPLVEMESFEIGAIKGIGSSIKNAVVELIEKGHFALLDDLKNQTPPGVLDMLQVKGMGPKKVLALWQELNIESLGELLYACNENRLVSLSGFGAKTQENIRKSVDYVLSNKGQRLYALADTEALEIEKLLTTIRDLQWARTGELRRQCTTLSLLEYVVNPIDAVQEFLPQHEFVLVGESDKAVCYKSPIGTEVYFYASDASRFFIDLLETTGPEAFLEKINYTPIEDDMGMSSEKAIFEHLNCNYIPPYIRDMEPLNITGIELDNIIQQTDIKGVVHAHSNWSDGAHSIAEMANAAKQYGYQYLVMTDHSKAAFYANGLQEDRVLSQHKEIDVLNKKDPNFKIIKGIEADILSDGKLDYEPEFLKNFEIIIASIHSNLNMDMDKANKRLINAIENPATSILGHPTGRLLLARPGYPIDHKKIIDACAANRVVIELNANPHRLDIDFKWINYCMDKGVYISINPDAHSIEGIGHIKFGVYAAQKAALTKHFTINSLSQVEFLDYFNKKQLKI